MFEDLCQVTLSINFNKSDEGDTSDLHSSPLLHNKNSERFKCYRCFGTGALECSECRGSELISRIHPMARLLNSVLMKKLKSKKCQQREDLQQTVEIIKEEEQELEQKKILCSFCELECEISLFYCQHCPWFHVCQRCELRHTEHQHIAHRNISGLCGKSVELSIKLCYSCGNRIQNCYMTCRTCEEQGNCFWICDSCSDSSSYIHDCSHKIETVIDYDSFKDNNLQTVSQEFQDDLNESISLNSDKEQEIEDGLKLNKKNSSIAQYLEPSDDSPLIISNRGKHKEMTSRVRFELDGLFSSYELASEFKVASKNILKPPNVVKTEEHFSCTISQSSYQSHLKDKENKSSHENIDFIFSGYVCDICSCHPIKNVRFHCTECENFDTCGKCFELIRNNHEHDAQAFQRIDGRQIKERALEKIYHNGRETVLKASLNLTSRTSNRAKTTVVNSAYN